MLRQTRIAIAAALALTAAGWVHSTESAAQTSAPAPTQSATFSPTAVEAAKDATKAAREVTFKLEGSGLQGTVRLYTIGRTRTRIVVTIPQGSQYQVRLYPGSDCSNNRAMAASAILMTPMNSVAVNAPQSQTIVELPIEEVTKNYLVDVRNMNQQSEAAAACAHLTP
jgi:hypothetical protein